MADIGGENALRAAISAAISGSASVGSEHLPSDTGHINVGGASYATNVDLVGRQAAQQNFPDVDQSRFKPTGLYGIPTMHQSITIPAFGDSFSVKSLGYENRGERGMLEKSREVHEHTRTGASSNAAANAEKIIENVRGLLGKNAVLGYKIENGSIKLLIDSNSVAPVQSALNAGGRFNAPIVERAAAPAPESPERAAATPEPTSTPAEVEPARDPKLDEVVTDRAVADKLITELRGQPNIDSVEMTPDGLKVTMVGADGKKTPFIPSLEEAQDLTRGQVPDWIANKAGFAAPPQVGSPRNDGPNRRNHQMGRGEELGFAASPAEQAASEARLAARASAQQAALDTPLSPAQKPAALSTVPDSLPATAHGISVTGNATPIESTLAPVAEARPSVTAHSVENLHGQTLYHFNGSEQDVRRMLTDADIETRHLRIAPDALGDGTNVITIVEKNSYSENQSHVRTRDGLNQLHTERLQAPHPPIMPTPTQEAAVTPPAEKPLTTQQLAEKYVALSNEVYAARDQLAQVRGETPKNKRVEFIEYDARTGELVSFADVTKGSDRIPMDEAKLREEIGQRTAEIETARLDIESAARSTIVQSGIEISYENRNGARIPAGAEGSPQRTQILESLRVMGIENPQIVGDQISLSGDRATTVIRPVAEDLLRITQENARITGSQAPDRVGIDGAGNVTMRNADGTEHSRIPTADLNPALTTARGDLEVNKAREASSERRAGVERQINSPRLDNDREAHRALMQADPSIKYVRIVGGESVVTYEHMKPINGEMVRVEESAVLTKNEVGRITQTSAERGHSDSETNRSFVRDVVAARDQQVAEALNRIRDTASTRTPDSITRTPASSLGNPLLDGDLNRAMDSNRSGSVYDTTTVPTSEPAPRAPESGGRGLVSNPRPNPSHQPGFVLTPDRNRNVAPPPAEIAADASQSHANNARSARLGTTMNVLGVAQGFNGTRDALAQGDYVRATGYGAELVANTIDAGADIGRVTGMVSQAGKFSAFASKAGTVGTVIAGATETVLSAKERYDSLDKNATAIDKAKAIELGASEGVTSFGANFVTGGLIGDAPKQLMRGGEKVLKENGLHEYTQHLPGQIQVAANAVAGLTDEETRLKASEASLPGQLVKTIGDNQIYGTEVRTHNAPDIDFNATKENLKNLAPPQLPDYKQLQEVHTEVFNAKAAEIAKTELTKTGRENTFYAEDINETLVANRFAELQKAGKAPDFKGEEVSAGSPEAVAERYGKINAAFDAHKRENGSEVLTHNEFTKQVEAEASKPEALKEQIARNQQEAQSLKDNRSWWEKTKDGATSLVVDEQATEHGMASAKAASASTELKSYERALDKYEKAVDTEIKKGFKDAGIENPTPEQIADARKQITDKGEKHLVEKGYKADEQEPATPPKPEMPEQLTKSDAKAPEADNPFLKACNQAKAACATLKQSGMKAENETGADKPEQTLAEAAKPLKDMQVKDTVETKPAPPLVSAHQQSSQHAIG